MERFRAVALTPDEVIIGHGPSLAAVRYLGVAWMRVYPEYPAHLQSWNPDTHQWETDEALSADVVGNGSAESPRYQLLTETGFIGNEQVNDPFGQEANDDPRALSAFISNAQRGGMRFLGIYRGSDVGQTAGSRWLQFIEDTGAQEIRHLVLAWMRPA